MLATNEKDGNDELDTKNLNQVKQLSRLSYSSSLSEPLDSSSSSLEASCAG